MAMRYSATQEAEAELLLIARAQAGDRRAFGDLVLRYRERVVSVVYRMCGDMRLAEDAAQDAFVSAWQHLPGYQPHRPFHSWLYRIALNRAFDLLRRERATVDIDEMPLAALAAGPEALAERDETAEVVRAAIAQLPPASRAVLVLREYEGLSYAEIAETLEIPLGTVMSRLNYARTRLRALLASLLEVA